MKKTSTILAIGSGLFLGQANAEIESEFHVGYNSKYIFRGLDLGRDAYEYGLNFAGTCDCGFDWTAGIWGISPDNEDGNIDELDIYGTVSKDFGFAVATVGFTAYTYDGNLEDDAEVSLGFSREFGDFNTGVTGYFGTDGFLQEQILLEATAGYSYDFSSTISTSLDVAYGYVVDPGETGGYTNDKGTAYVSVTLSADMALSDEITFSPYVSFVEGESDQIGLGAFSGFFGGATLGFKF